jgi:hypothetical protein
MAAVANNPKFAKKVGVPSSVGKEFLTADKGKKFKEGGEMRNTSRMNRLEELGRVDAEKASTAKGKKNLTAEKKRIVKEMKMSSGGKTMKKMASGGLSAGHKSADGIARKGKTKGKMVKMGMGGKTC